MGISKNAKSQRGASMFEYILILAVLVPVFVIAAVKIKEAAEYRAEQTTLTVKKFVPCSGAGSLLKGAECY